MIQTAALADLHRHLDGSLRTETVHELAAAAGIAVPHNLGFYAGMGLAEALSRFAFTLSLLRSPESVRRAAREICEDAAREGVTSLEIRFAPQLHSGAPIAAIVDAALEGADGQAGIILCGLYGEPPSVLEELVALGASRRGVVGIDLAGGPAAVHTYRMEDYAPAFSRARDLGLGRTVHAAEGRPPNEIACAIHSLHAQRIGHGTTLLDDPSVVDLVVERQITIEACITSNVQTSAIQSALDHPLPNWLKLGARACICTDNTLLSRVSAQSEHALAASLPGMSKELLEQAIQYGHKAAFNRKS